MKVKMFTTPVLGQTKLKNIQPFKPANIDKPVAIAVSERHEQAKKALSKRLDDVFEKERKASEVEIKRSLKKLQKAFKMFNTCIRFDIESELDNQLVVRVVDKTSGETVFQIPSEKALDIKRLAKQFPGLIVDELI
jgi:flagellar protein FlaG